MRRITPLTLLLGFALAGCDSGPSAGDKVKPELPRVTVEVKGMS
jgi:hypothetical protein